MLFVLRFFVVVLLLNIRSIFGFILHPISFFIAPSASNGLLIDEVFLYLPRAVSFPHSGVLDPLLTGYHLGAPSPFLAEFILGLIVSFGFSVTFVLLAFKLFFSFLILFVIYKFIYIFSDFSEFHSFLFSTLLVLLLKFTLFLYVSFLSSGSISSFLFSDDLLARFPNLLVSLPFYLFCIYSFIQVNSRFYRILLSSFYVSILLYVNSFMAVSFFFGSFSNVFISSSVSSSRTRNSDLLFSFLLTISAILVAHYINIVSVFSSDSLSFIFKLRFGYINFPGFGFSFYLSLFICFFSFVAIFFLPTNWFQKSPLSNSISLYVFTISPLLAFIIINIFGYFTDQYLQYSHFVSQVFLPSLVLFVPLLIFRHCQFRQTFLKIFLPLLCIFLLVLSLLSDYLWLSRVSYSRIYPLVTELSHLLSPLKISKPTTFLAPFYLAPSVRLISPSLYSLTSFAPFSSKNYLSMFNDAQLSAVLTGSTFCNPKSNNNLDISGYYEWYIAHIQSNPPSTYSFDSLCSSIDSFNILLVTQKPSLIISFYSPESLDLVDPSFFKYYHLNSSSSSFYLYFLND